MIRVKVWKHSLKDDELFCTSEWQVASFSYFLLFPNSVHPIDHQRMYDNLRK